MLAWINNWISGNPPVNVWLGITVCNQEEADRDIPKLLDIPAAKRFLSIEPMLGAITFEGFFASAIINDVTNALEEIDVVICGGETGRYAWPLHPDFVRLLRDQCREVEVPFFFKGWGKNLPLDQVDVNGEKWVPLDTPKRPGSKDWFVPCGKNRSGRLLDGVEHLEMPE